MSLIIDVLYYIFTFPRLIFSYVGYNPHFPFLIASKSELDQLGFDGSSDSLASQLSTVFAEEEDSWLDSLVPSISCYFPAVLKFGAVKYDMTLISLLVISAFVAILTTSFVLLIIALYPATFFSWLLKRARQSSDDPTLDSGDKTAAKDHAAVMRKFFQASGELDVEHFQNVRSGVACTGELTIHRSQCPMYPEFEIQANALESLLQIMNIPYNVLKSDKLNIPVMSLDGNINVGYDEALTFIELMFPLQFSEISIPAECQIQAHFIKLHVFHHISRLLHQGRLDSTSLDPFRAPIGERSDKSDLKNWENLLTSVDILSTVLGDKLYYLSDGLTEIDIVVFAAIDQILRHCPKEQNATYLLQEFPNLCSWFARITQEILSCKNPCQSDTSESSTPVSVSTNNSKTSSRNRKKRNEKETRKQEGSADVKTFVNSSGDYHSSNNDEEALKNYVGGCYNFEVADMKTFVESECSSVYNQELEDDDDELAEFSCFSDQKPVMDLSMPTQSVQ